jgi:molecular chaperone DnaJ
MTESILGGTKIVTFDQNVKCTDCQGSRGSDEKECSKCKGTGIIRDPLFKKESKCNYCHGFGAIVSKKCQTCDGNGLVSKSVSKEIEIPK